MFTQLERARTTPDVDAHRQATCSGDRGTYMACSSSMAKREESIDAQACNRCQGSLSVYGAKNRHREVFDEPGLRDRLISEG